MGFHHQAGTDFQVGGFLSEPGTYHFCVTDVDEYPTNATGSLIDNAAFRVTVESLAGTVPGQEKKQCDLLFFHPKPCDKNEGAFARKKMDRFFLAVMLMSEDDKGRAIDIQLASATGRQFIAKMEADEKNPKYVRVAFAEIYHVDDPAVATIPKSEAGLKLLPATQRRISKQDSKQHSKPPVSAATKPSSAAATSQGVLDPWSGGL